MSAELRPPEVAVPLDDHEDAIALIGELGVARAQLAAARIRYAEAEARVRTVLGEPTEPGSRIATYRGRPVARLKVYQEKRVNLGALRDSWPEVAATVTETHLRGRFTVELTEEVAA